MGCGSSKDKKRKGSLSSSSSSSSSSSKSSRNSSRKRDEGSDDDREKKRRSSASSDGRKSRESRRHSPSEGYQSVPFGVAEEDTLSTNVPGTVEDMDYINNDGKDDPVPFISSPGLRRRRGRKVGRRKRKKKKNKSSPPPTTLHRSSSSKSSRSSSSHSHSHHSPSPTTRINYSQRHRSSELDEFKRYISDDDLFEHDRGYDTDPIRRRSEYTNRGRGRRNRRRKGNVKRDKRPFPNSSPSRPAEPIRRVAVGQSHKGKAPPFWKPPYHSTSNKNDFGLDPVDW